MKYNTCIYKLCRSGEGG